MLRAIRGFVHGLWDFVVGDDWVTALGVLAGFGAVAAIAATRTSAWWVMPIVVALLLSLSVLRVARAAMRR
ncbi:MAG: hypothetical protein ACYCUM_08695 [Solirubrobacteraceae bacterium]